MATGNSPDRATPGVYVVEGGAFGASVVGVATAVPVFVGYTRFAGDPVTGVPLYDRPVAISSMGDFISYFGDPAAPRFTLAADAAVSGGFILALAPDAGAADSGVFNLFWQLRLFFANGGETCFVVSVGSYGEGDYPTHAGNIGTAPPGAIRAADLIRGLDAASQAVGATMLVVPEACQLDLADYGKVACAMLTQASDLQDRLAILDLPGCMVADALDRLIAAQNDFWAAIAPASASLSYGAAYAPAVRAAIVTASDISYSQLAADGGCDVVNGLLTSEAMQLYRGGQLASVRAAIATAFPPAAGIAGRDPHYSDDGSAYPALAPPQTAGEWQGALDTFLRDALPVYARIAQAMADTLNVQPPSGAIAGIWAQNDAQTGVWNAPANRTLAAVAAPLCAMTDAQQGGFNVPLNGMAIDVLRAFPGRGVLVWGARTLDGNSFDYRYVHVRRTLNYIKQSIRLALQSYGVAANDATTWVTVTNAISAFLTGLWQQGGLMGAKASDAFAVGCGLGSTMTPQDVIDGRMVVSVTLQLVRPAEFIELGFVQMMEGGAAPIANPPQ